MSRMKEYLYELESDFENLTTTSMGWDKSWLHHVEAGRFPKFNKSDFIATHIYWFDCYAAVVAAKSILREMGEDYKVSMDEVMTDWAIITTYTSNVWKGL